MRLKITKLLLYFISIEWTIWLLAKPIGTTCFNLFDSYMTAIVLLASMIINDFIE